MYRFTIKRLKNIVSDFGKVDYYGKSTTLRVCCVGKPAIAGYVLQTPT